MDGPWTLPELTARAAAALAQAGTPRVGGRARDLPNERMIRWYVTIGLVDPPLSRRGRVALYGTRHLLQLVAVKRLQADGRSLTEIQAELTGATEAMLHEIARIRPPAEPAAGAPGGSAHPSVPPGASEAAPPRGDRRPAGPRRFWTERPPAPPTSPARPETSGALVHGVRLAPGVTLVLDASPSPEDAAAIVATAGPLIDLLTERGLL